MPLLYQTEQIPKLSICLKEQNFHHSYVFLGTRHNKCYCIAIITPCHANNDNLAKVYINLNMFIFNLHMTK